MMESAPKKNLIACARCHHAKIRCDKKIPCTQCVSKNAVCHPRWSSRFPHAAEARKNGQQAKRNISHDGSAQQRRNTANERPQFISRESSFQIPTSANVSDDLNFIATASPSHLTLNVSPGDDGLLSNPMSTVASPSHLNSGSSNGFFDPWHPSQVSSFGLPDDVSFMPDSTGFDTNMSIDAFDMNTSTDWFSSAGTVAPTAISSPAFEPKFNPQQMAPTSAFGAPTPVMSSTTFTPRPQMPNAEASRHRSTSSVEVVEKERDEAHEAWPYVKCNQDLEPSELRKPAGSVLEDLCRLLQDGRSSERLAACVSDFDDYEKHCPVQAYYKGMPRDRLLGVLHMWVQKAIRNERDKTPNRRYSFEGSSEPILTLPPAETLEKFVALYRTCVRSSLPPASIMCNLLDGPVETGCFPMLLAVAHGAILAPSHEAHALAFGFIEICRHALSEMLEKYGLYESTVGHCALLYVALCAWSGEKLYVDFAFGQRAMILSMLQLAGMFSEQGAQNINLDRSQALETWKGWRASETRNRLVYAWLQLDQEMCLFQDVATSLQVGVIENPLPGPDELMFAESENEWMDRYEGLRQNGYEPAGSLKDLFKQFISGDLQQFDRIPQEHLRLLLYPLQSMAAQHLENLEYFPSTGLGTGNRMVYRLNLLTRLQEVRNLLQQWADLAERCVKASAPGRVGEAALSSSYTAASFVMYHLISLNTWISIPDIERVAKDHTPGMPPAVHMFRDFDHYEAQSVILYHAGQVIRLLTALPRYARPKWWPVALYRASIVCWSLSVLSSAAPTPAASPKSRASSLNGGGNSFPFDSSPVTVAINACSSDDPSMQRYLNRRIGTPLFQLPSGNCIPVLFGCNALDFCLQSLEKDNCTRLSQGIVSRLKELARRCKL